MKNYIFDFGKVIVEYEPSYMTEFYVTDPSDAALVREVVFDRLYWDRLDAGTIEYEELQREICARLPVHLQAPAMQAYDHWVEHLPLIPGIPELIRQIKASGGRLYLLSNISKKFVQDYPSVPALSEVLSLFDGLVFSAPIGLVKPDGAIFRHLLDRYNLNPQESIFIDDNPHNVAAARGEGISAYLFDGDAQALRKYLGK